MNVLSVDRTSMGIKSIHSLLRIHFQPSLLAAKDVSPERRLRFDPKKFHTDNVAFGVDTQTFVARTSLPRNVSSGHGGLAERGEERRLYQRVNQFTTLNKTQSSIFYNFVYSTATATIRYRARLRACSRFSLFLATLFSRVSPLACFAQCIFVLKEKRETGRSVIAGDQRSPHS